MSLNKDLEPTFTFLSLKVLTFMNKDFEVKVCHLQEGISKEGPESRRSHKVKSKARVDGNIHSYGSFLRDNFS